jgi:hypothetical protein
MVRKSVQRAAYNPEEPEENSLPDSAGLDTSPIGRSEVSQIKEGSVPFIKIWIDNQSRQVLKVTLTMEKALIEPGFVEHGA